MQNEEGFYLTVLPMQKASIPSTSFKESALQGEKESSIFKRNSFHLDTFICLIVIFRLFIIININYQLFKIPLIVINND